LCVCFAKYIAPPNEVEQTEVKTDYKKDYRLQKTVNSNRNTEC